MSPHRKYCGLDWLMSKIKQIKFHCHSNISEYTKLLHIFNFLIEMFMHVYISHSRRAITISFLYNINPSKKNCKIKGY